MFMFRYNQGKFAVGAGMMMPFSSQYKRVEENPERLRSQPYEHVRERLQPNVDAKPSLGILTSAASSRRPNKENFGIVTRIRVSCDDPQIKKSPVLITGLFFSIFRRGNWNPFFNKLIIYDLRMVLRRSQLIFRGEIIPPKILQLKVSAL